MNRCKKVINELAAYLSGELTERDRQAVESHLKKCPSCRSELEEFRIVVDAADLLGAELRRDLGDIDFEILSEKITAGTIPIDSKERDAREPGRRKDDSRRRAFRRSRYFSPQWRPVLAGVLAGLIVGTGLTVMVFRMASSGGRDGADYAVNPAFLERVEYEMARRETIDYLDQSAYLLLDFVQATSSGETQLLQPGLSSERARELMSRKKYLNPQLEKFRLAKAKAICDQIELLFYELADMSDELTDEEFAEIRRFIEDRQILLTIKIVKKELEKSEV
ncbi:MAG: zf-HC2 domain-containing protein [Acidobacteriota bacterium]